MLGGSSKLNAVLMVGMACLVAIFAGVMFSDIDSVIYALATRQPTPGIMVLLLLVGAMVFPFYQRWHHVLLVASINSTLVAFFLPGEQPLWAAFTVGSLGVVGLQMALRRQSLSLLDRKVVQPLLILLAVVLVTAFFRGGISGQALGAEMWGGRRYLAVITAIAAAFALASRAVPPDQRRWYALLFVGSQMAAMGSDVVIWVLGESSLLLRMFNSTLAQMQTMTEGTLSRFSGIAFMGMGLMNAMLCWFGAKQILDLRSPWRLAGMLLGFAFTLLGGFRSGVIFMTIVFGIQFVVEGLHKTRLLPALIGVSLVVLIGIAPVVDRLPLSVQRSLSFLPYDIDNEAKTDATGTANWRLDLWRAALPVVPDYLFLGKGYLFDSTDLMLTQIAMSRATYFVDEGALIHGNYHSGILTLLITFGLPGFGVFLWLLWRIWQVLYANYRWGDPSIKTANTFLLVSFLARTVFFFTLYGQFDLDLIIFTGLLGMSVSLNGGIRRSSDRRVEPETPASAEPVRSLAHAR
jgi:O-antigen ligase